MCSSEGFPCRLEAGSRIFLPRQQLFANLLLRNDCCMHCLPLFPGQMLGLQRKKRSNGCQMPSLRVNQLRKQVRKTLNQLQRDEDATTPLVLRGHFPRALRTELFIWPGLSVHLL